MIVVYLDDSFGAAADKNKAKIASLQVHADLKFGFLPNKVKCIWEPTQVLLGSEPFSTLPLLKFMPLISGLPVYKKT